MPGLLALISCAGGAPAPATVNVSVDATAAGTPLERVWPFYGYDEINYTTAPEGKALLGTIAAAHTAPVHVRSHFLLNTGDGTPAMKWGSTNVYTEDAAGNPVYSWTLTDGIMDTITAAGAFPFVEIGFMPEALSTHPTPYRNSSTTTARRRLLLSPDRLHEVGGARSARGRRTRTNATRTSRRAGCGSCGTNPTSATGTARSPNTRSSTTTRNRRCTR